MKKTCLQCKNFEKADIPHFGFCKLDNDYSEKYDSETACKKFSKVEKPELKENKKNEGDKK